MNKKQAYLALGICLMILPLYTAQGISSQPGQDFFLAVHDNNLEKVTELSKHPYFSNSINRETLLDLACKKKFAEGVLALLTHFNFSQDTKDKALASMTLDGHTSIVEILLNNGANQGNTEIISDNSTSLILACTKGHYDIVKLFLEQSTDHINSQNMYGSTPFMMVCAGGYYNIAKLLLDRGADPTIAGDENDTPLIVAANKGHYDVVKLLLDHSPDQINAQNVYGETALMLALDKDHKNIVLLLLDKGADPSIKNEDGNTPVMGLLARKEWHLLDKIISQRCYQSLLTQKNNNDLSAFDVLLNWRKKKIISKPTLARFKRYSGNYKNDLSEEQIEEAIKHLLNPPPRAKKTKEESTSTSKKKKKKKKKGKAFTPAQAESPEKPKEEFKDLPGAVGSTTATAKNLLEELEKTVSNFSIHLTKSLSQWQQTPREQLKRDGYFLRETPRGTILKKLNSEHDAHHAQQIIINAHSLVPRFIIKNLVEHPIDAKTKANETRMSLPLTIVTSKEQLKGTYELFFKETGKHEIVVYHSLFKDHRYKDLLTQLPTSTLEKKTFEELERSSEEDEKQSEVKREDSWKHASKWSVTNTPKEITFTDNRNNTTYTILKYSNFKTPS